jgi:hypothetical protein
VTTTTTVSATDRALSVSWLVIALMCMVLSSCS